MFSVCAPTSSCCKLLVFQLFLRTCNPQTFVWTQYPLWALNAASEEEKLHIKCCIFCKPWLHSPLPCAAAAAGNPAHPGGPWEEQPGFFLCSDSGTSMPSLTCSHKKCGFVFRLPAPQAICSGAAKTGWCLQSPQVLPNLFYLVFLQFALSSSELMCLRRCETVVDKDKKRGNPAHSLWLRWMLWLLKTCQCVADREDFPYGINSNNLFIIAIICWLKISWPSL